MTLSPNQRLAAIKELLERASGPQPHFPVGSGAYRQQVDQLARTRDTARGQVVEEILLVADMVPGHRDHSPHPSGWRGYVLELLDLLKQTGA